MSASHELDIGELCFIRSFHAGRDSGFDLESLGRWQQQAGSRAYIGFKGRGAELSGLGLRVI